MHRIIFLFLILLLSACSSTRAPRLWDATSIASDPHAVAAFLDRPKGRIIASVKTADVRKMIYIKERVEQAAGELRTGLLVADDQEPNGFSFVYHGQPMIAVNIGMINLLGQDDAAMAALMGHELAHLYLRHSDRRVKREENRLVASTVLSFALGMMGVPTPMEATDIATTSVANSFSRDEEREADQFGVEFMAHAGFDPWGAVRLQEKLSAVAGKSMLPFLSTHPTSAERVDNMKQLAMETRPDTAAALPQDGSLEQIRTITLPPLQE